jgi:hypothetical protein
MPSSSDLKVTPYWGRTAIDTLGAKVLLEERAITIQAAQ